MPTADTSTNSHAHSSAVHDKTANAGSEFEDDEEEEDKRPRKRVKRTKSPAKRSARKGKSKIPEQFRKVRGKTGLLEKLAKDVPLDVILEIFCYLDPGDLLRLARTTRDLRGTLMSKSSETVWRTAREGVEGIPPLPKDLNEPQYAHLLYESYCHICGHKPCDTVYWSFRIRCCKKCTVGTFVARDSSSDFYWSLPSRLETVPHVIPVIFKRGPKGQWDGYLAHHPPTTKRYVAEFEDLATSEEQEKWIVYQDHERRMQTHNNLCQAWLKTKLGERGKELQDIRNQRKAAILERLGDIGWREEAELIIGRRGHEDEFSDHKLVRQSKKLTNHGWNSIKDELVRWLEEQKTRRIGRERQETVSSRYQLLTEQIKSVKATRDLREPFPGVSEVLNHKILEDIVWETPIDEDITPDAMKAKLDEHLPEIVEQWRSAKVQELLQCLRLYRPQATESDLHLTTAVFECSSCRLFKREESMMHYPQMFHHSCCLDSTTTTSSRLRFLWSAKRLRISANACQIAKRIVEACSMDPATATVQDLNYANPLIECETCNHPDRRRTFRWLEALAHDARLSHPLKISNVIVNTNISGDELEENHIC